MAEAGTLAYFDKSTSTKVIEDVSPVGLGAVLIQNQNGAWAPICYASRSLTECERKYSQMEKEVLALVWACEMYHFRITQAEGVEWKKELRRYVTKYRSIDHTTTGKSPAELLFNRKMRGKLPELHVDCRLDLETRDRDAEVKGKTKAYADKAANAKSSDITVGDQVLVRQERKDKFSTPFNTTPYRVVSKTGSSVIVEALGGTQYSPYM